MAQLVDRREELAALREAVLALEGGSPRALVLSGDPGIGKSRLLEELERLSEESGHLVLVGRASELEGDLPYAIFVDALDTHLRALGRERVDRIDAQLGGELAHIFPAIASLARQSTTVLDERYRAHAAVRDLLERLAVERSVVLVLDDLHWADGASVDLLGSLLRRPPQASVLLAIGVRPRQASPRLTMALERAAPAWALTPLELKPLAEADARALVDRTVQPSVWSAIYRESGGNPFYLQELTKAVMRSTDVAAFLEWLRSGSSADRGHVVGSPSVGRALAQEVDLLSAPARLLLGGAAVQGDPFELALAARCAGVSMAEATEALDELVRRDLVRQGNSPRRFQFRHPLVRWAILESTPTGWRLSAHRRAAEALAERGESPVAQAPHVEQFAQRADREAIALLLQAADASAQRAPASAARWYRVALDLLPEDDTTARERADLLLALASVRAGNGQFEASRAALLEAIELGAALSATHTAELIGACARLEHLTGRQQEARARLVAAFDLLPDRDSGDAVGLMLDLAADAFFHTEYDRTKEWGLRALETARTVGRASLIAAAAATVSMAAAFLGRVEEAEIHRAEAAAIIDALSDDELAERLDAIANLGTAEMYLNRFRDSAEHLGRGLNVGRANGQGALFPLLTQVRGAALFMLGRLEESAGVLDGSIEAARLSGTPYSLAWALANRSWTALFAGDVEAALNLAVESLELVGPFEESFVTAYAAAHLGLALIEAGEPALALETILPAAGGPDLPLVAGVWNVVIQEAVTRAYLALGSLSEAAQSAARAEDVAEALNLNFARAMAMRARAAVQLAAHDAAAAARLALASAAAADAIDVPLEAARARILAGRALTATGDHAAAAAELERAASVLDASGAVRYRDEAERGLRRLGRRFERRKPASREDAVASLTPRELEIAELVMRRMTNREIAAHLFLSEKTVETHLRNVFGKLGVSSRASIGRLLQPHATKLSA